MADQIEKEMYSYREFAAATGLSYSSVKNMVRDCEIVPVYYKSKPLIPVEELKRWKQSLSPERRAS